MKSNVWLRLVWSDYQLQWDEADYGGIGVLRLPPDKVWKVRRGSFIMGGGSGGIKGYQKFSFFNFLHPQPIA